MAHGYLYLVAVMGKAWAWRGACRICSMSFSVSRPSRKRWQDRLGIFDADQGSQFTDDDFIDVLRVHGVAISMDGCGRFSDNIFVERLWRSLKYGRRSSPGVSKRGRGTASDGQHPQICITASDYIKPWITAPRAPVFEEATRSAELRRRKRAPGVHHAAAAR